MKCHNGLNQRARVGVIIRIMPLSLTYSELRKEGPHCHGLVLFLEEPETGSKISLLPQPALPFFSETELCLSVCRVMGSWDSALGKERKADALLTFCFSGNLKILSCLKLSSCSLSISFSSQWLFLKISPKHAEAPCFKTATALFSSVCVQPLCSLSAEMLRLWSRAASSLQGELRLSGLIVLASATVKSFN